jgi:phosphate acetyltransferase
VAEPVLVGEEDAVRTAMAGLKVDESGLEVVDPSASSRAEEYARVYGELTDTPMRTASLVARQPLFYAALALHLGDADGMLGGAVYSSGDFESVCLSVIGLQDEIAVPSSFFVMEVPGYEGGEDGVLVFADAALNANPDSEELASIAVATARSARDLLGWEPRVAMLSFSTRGSATHDDVQKVVEACKLAGRSAEEQGFALDGEMQVDTALVPGTARRKLGDDVGPVAGRANVLIFPDLDAANAAYKLTQVLAGATALGPILQGFRRPVSDLSRGATIDDIVGSATIVALLSAAGQL